MDSMTATDLGRAALYLVALGTAGGALLWLVVHLCTVLALAVTRARRRSATVRAWRTVPAGSFVGRDRADVAEGGSSLPPRRACGCLRGTEHVPLCRFARR